MKVFRFMSKKEFKLFKSGKTLINDAEHKKVYDSDSVGFCFFDEDDYSPEYAYEFLSGIVSNDVCVRFEVDKSLLIKSHGIYADPFGDNFFSTMGATEYCCTSYNNKDFKMLSYSIGFSDYDFDWTKIA